MMDAGTIEPVEELESISPILVQDKNTNGEVWIYVNLINLNDVCFHDSFPTPFTDKVLESVWVKKFTHSLMGSLATIIL